MTEQEWMELGKQVEGMVKAMGHAKEPPKPQGRMFLFRSGADSGPACLGLIGSGIAPMRGTATELPAQGTKEYEALVERLLGIWLERGQTEDCIRAILTDLFKAEAPHAG